MRVIVESGEIHGWMPAGAFTIHADGRVSWHTPYAPLVQHAGGGDDEVVLPDRALAARLLGGEDLADALPLPGGRVAVARGGETPRVELVDAATGAVERTIPLRAAGPRLPGLSEDESWEGADDVMRGYGARAIRLHPSPDGFFVTANESGHVARYALAEGRFVQVLRVPGAPENELYAARDGAATIVGIKFNHRHSELYRVSDAGELLARWPDPGEVRWGMPGLAVREGWVLTYSDEGPHRRELALLDAALREVAHAKLEAWPVSLHAEGDRFACVSGEQVVTGRFGPGALSVERTWSVDELMKSAGVKAPPRPSAATDDGRGQRRWVEAELDFLAVERGVALIQRRKGGEISALALEGGEPRILQPAQEPKRLPDGKPDLFAPGPPSAFDLRDGTLALRDGDAIALVEIASGRERARLTLDPGRGCRARVLAGGIFSAVENDSDRILWSFTDASGANTVVSESARTMGEGPHLVISDGAAWWLEFQEEVELLRHEVTPRGVVHRELQQTSSGNVLCRWSPGGARSSVQLDPTLEMLGLAVHAGVAFVLARKDGDSHLFRISSNGAVERLTRDPLPYFCQRPAATEGQVLFIEPQTTSSQGIHPSSLNAFDLRSGAVKRIATATVGSFSHLTIDGGRAVWLEAVSGGAAFFKIGHRAGASAICWAPLPL